MPSLELRVIVLGSSNRPANVETVTLSYAECGSLTLYLSSYFELIMHSFQYPYQPGGALHLLKVLLV